MEAPRPTGNARSAAIIGMLCIAAYAARLSRSPLFFAAAAFCGALLIFYQARGSVLAFLVTSGLFWLCAPKRLRPTATKIIQMLVMATVLFGVILGSIYASNKIFVEKVQDEGITKSAFRDFTPTKLGSGRLEHWHNGLVAFSESPLIGHGSQADRKFVGQNVSSMPIYILICGGLIGFLAALLAVVRPLQRSFNSSRRATPIETKTAIFYCSLRFPYSAF